MSDIFPLEPEPDHTVGGALRDEPLWLAPVERWIGPDELVTVAEIG